MLPIDDFRQVVRHAPLVSVDLIVENEHGQYLLGWRNNQPAVHHWFVPGGRIFKNETRAAAFARIAATELGLSFELEQSELQGVYEHFYSESYVGDDVSTHYVVIAHRLRVLSEQLILPHDVQHARYLWLSRAEILVHPQVHTYTRNYFLVP